MVQTRKWALGALTAVAVLLLVALAVEKAIWHGPYDEIRDALWQIELDSSMDEVSVAVPFDPIRTEEHSDTRSGRPAVVWYYDHHPVAAVIPSVVFDKESSRVIAVYVDDVRHRRALLKRQGSPTRWIQGSGGLVHSLPNPMSHWRVS